MIAIISQDTVKEFYQECWKTLKKDYPQLDNIPIPTLALISKNECVDDHWACYRPAVHSIRLRNGIFNMLQDGVLPWEQLQDTIWHELTHVLVHGVGHPKRFWDILDEYGPIGKKITAYKRRRQQ